MLHMGKGHHRKEENQEQMIKLFQHMLQECSNILVTANTSNESECGAGGKGEGEGEEKKMLLQQIFSKLLQCT